MAQRHVLRLSSINNFFKEDIRLVSRGENAVESNHVKNMIYDSEEMVIRGEVEASMRSRVYKVELHLDSEYEICEGSCTCPRGQVLCHHMAALAIYGHYNISVTDKACVWAARKTKDVETKTIDEICPRKQHRTTNRKIKPEEIEKLADDLSKFGGAVGFTWLLSTQSTSELECLCVNVEEVLLSADYRQSTNKKEFLKEKLKLSKEQIENIQKSTIGQFKNENWLVCRKNRLTASKFGIILRAVKRNRYSDAFYKQLTDSYNLDGIRAIQWGRVNEDVAVKVFEEQTGRKVEKSGIWFHECGFLGASPDGIVDNGEVLEVKCPYKYREASLYEGITKNNNYIVIFENDNYVVNKKHNYYHQIQGQLWIMDRKVCHLVIWTPYESLLVGIEKDPEWKNNLDLLQKFYLDKYLEYLLK